MEMNANYSIANATSVQSKTLTLNHSPTKSISLAFFGTFIEYYDYALYSFAAPLLALAFFPKSDPTVALLKAYGVFIAGFCAKPFGSLFFSLLGDRYGRALVLKISITGIAIPTLFIGIVPDYSHIGWVATLALLLARIFHGFFVAGESDSARVFIYELLDNKYRYLSTSLLYFICLLGIYAASLNISIATKLATSEFLIYGYPIAYWRLPFIIGGLIGIGLFYLRKNLGESPAFLKEQQKISFPYSNFKDISKQSIFSTLLLTGTVGGQYHFYFVFLNQYLSSILNQYTEASASSITSNLLLVFTVTLPIAGFMADKLTRRFEIISLLKMSALMITATAAINIFYTAHGILPTEIMYLTVISMAFTHANTFVVILKQFDVSKRCRGSSLGHSLGSMILSGSTPFLSLWIWKHTQNSVAPLFYFLLLAILNFAALFLVKPGNRTQRVY